jgi:glycosyltransferase involved in cell wall biosynthesis
MYALAPLYYLARLRGRFDVIVDSENGIPQFTPCFTRVPKIALTYHVHRRVFLAHMPRTIAWFFIWLELGLVPLLYRRVRFITISNTTKEEMLQHGKTRFPVAVIEPGIAEGLSPGTRAKEPTILYLGRLERYKRVDHLIHAVKRLRTEIPTLQLEIAGTGTEAESLRALADRIGVSDIVRFHDFVTEDEKRRLLQQAWVFATPSEMEGWGIGVIEAAACATPAIAYDVPGLREAIIDGKTGLLATEFDHFVDAVRRVLEDGLLRANMGRVAAERAAGFGWEKRASAFLEILESTAWSGARGAAANG